MPRLTCLWRPGAFLTAALVALVGSASCHKGGGGPGPGPEPVGVPVITCPADISKDVEQGPLTVNYDAPIVTGGAAPITTACSPASGTSFPGGTTDVICSATDAIQQRAQCLFHVAVNVIPRLKGTTFLAFGDSITWGEVSQAVSLAIHDQDPINNYPVQLQASLRDKYRLQASQITVVNQGQQGEHVCVGKPRLAELLQASVPDVVILLEGTNDANDGTTGCSGITGSPAGNADHVVSTLRDDVKEARGRGVKLVIWSTLLPEVAGRPGSAGVDRIPVINQLIRDYKDRTDAVLVDAFEAFDPQKELLIGADGTHPTVAGYKKLAGLFLDAIAANFQQPAPASPAFFSRPVVSRTAPAIRSGSGAGQSAARTSTPPSRRPH